MTWPLLLGSIASQGPQGPIDTGVDQGSYVVTIPSGTVGSNLTDFAVVIPLREMPAAFWLHDFQVDGDNIYVYEADGVTLIPHDVTFFDKSLKQGRVVCKKTTTSGTDTNVTVVVRGSAIARLGVTDVNGRNAVWSDYEVAVMFPEAVNRTGAIFGGDFSNLQPDTRWTQDGFDTNAPGNPHQGLALDGTSIITIDTDYLRRALTTALTPTLATNNSPLLDSGIAGVDHLGDGCIVAGELYVPIEEYPNAADDNQHIGVYDSTTLVFLRSYDISAQAHEASSIAYDGTKLWITSYKDDTQLFTYDTAGAYLGAVALSSNIVKMQGIAFYDGKLYVAGEIADALHEVELDGTNNGIVLDKFWTGTAEGLDFSGDTLWWLDGDGDLSWHSRGDNTDYRRLHFKGAYIELPFSDVWTAGVSILWTDIAGDLQQGFLSMTQLGTSSADRATLAYDNGPDTISLWNSSNGWVTPTPSYNPGGFDHFSLSFAHNGTTGRKLQANGTVGEDLGVSARPKSGDPMILVVNASESDNTEDGSGYYNFLWARAEYMSDDWMIAVRDMMDDPATFYTIVAAP